MKRGGGHDNRRRAEWRHREVQPYDPPKVTKRQTCDLDKIARGGFQGLVCGTSYTLGVEVADAAGNVAVRATKSAAKLPSSGQASSGPSRIRTPDRS
jgi:hypothetical protein